MLWVMSRLRVPRVELKRGKGNVETIACKRAGLGDHSGGEVDNR